MEGSSEKNLMETAIGYLADKGITVGQTEGGGDSVVLHVAPADREKITGEVKADMEAFLNANVETAGMYGMSVIMVERKDLNDQIDTESETEDSEPKEENQTTDESETEDFDQEEKTEPDAGTENVEVAQYEITGLVDYFDEQGNIIGQFPKGSIQELPVSVGNRAVEAGQAEMVQ